MNILVEADSDQEPIGFHAQQAVENALKGWISALDEDYHNIHDISELAAIVRARPEEDDTDAAERLSWLTEYAVRYRYEGARIEVEDRYELLQHVTETVLSIIERIRTLSAAEDRRSTGDK